MNNLFNIRDFFDIFSLEFFKNIENLPSVVIEILSKLFPVLLCIAIVVLNLSLITGAIMYLLESNENNGKLMIQRSIIIQCLIFTIFNPYSSDSVTLIEPFEGFKDFTSFITSYLLFIFAALSCILVLMNLGLYLLYSDKKIVYRLKKSFFCLLCVILPLSFQFPNIPIWVM